jgi:alpha-tubulin suppressor-like RCC1 family protein
MIASVVMLIVLLSGLVTASSANTAIRDQYRLKAMQMASDAGVAMVNACLARSYNAVTWTGKILRPNTNCNGDTIAGSAYVMDTPTLKTTFEVPELTIENGTQRANVTAKVLSYRASGAGTPVESSISRSAMIGGQTGFSNVTFGYCSSSCGGDVGAQLAVVLATGEVKTLGRNSNGRLGNGNLTDSATPSTFILPINERGIAAFSNFLSIGRQISVVTASGKAFSAGSNEYGQLGNPASGTTNPISTPVQFILPANENARFVGVSNYATYVISQNSVTGNTSVYAAGSCTNGILGTGAGCAQTTTPVRVALPTPTSDQNTQPEPISDWTQSTNFNVDRFNAYVRMKGGAVYGWGINDWGQLGDTTMTTRTTPIRIQAHGSYATPSATQIAFSGNSLYILDTNGRVWATGENASYGELGGAGVAVRNGGNTTVCLQKDTASSYVVTPACDGNNGWQYMEFWPDGTWRFRTDSRTYGPTDSMLCATAPASLGGSSYVQMLTCNGAANQQWQFRSDKTIYSPYNNGCIEPYANVYMVACNPAYTYQQWTVQNSLYLRPLPTPPGNPLATRITTDNSGVQILYANGDIWAAGGNNRGQLGIGASYMSTYNPVLRKVILPAGVRAVDLYATDLGPIDPPTGVNNGSYNNSYFVLEDGRVYGAGANNFGQLGVNATYDYAATPVMMQLPLGVLGKTVQSAYGTTVVLSSTGKIYTVGNNSNGQLGNGTLAPSWLPEANTYTNQRTTISY